MASKNKSIVVKNHNNQRNFKYQKGNVSLNFSLNLNIKSEMKDFLDLLNEAATEVKEVIDQK